MTSCNVGDSSGQALTGSFIEELTKRSQKLFYARVDAMMPFYRAVFDDRPDCTEIIGTPADGRPISPTLFMIYREARFALDSDLSDAKRLDADWAFLHIKVQDVLDPEQTAKMLALNVSARWQIVKCQDRLSALMPRLSALIDQGRNGEATLIFYVELAVVDETFNKVIDSYNQLALQPH